VARRCRHLGLSPIVLTDHDGIEGATALAEAGEPVIIGQEILTTEGEVIGLFLKAAVRKGLSPEETVAAIKEQGGLVYLEHPYDITRRRLREEAIERIASGIDIVEVFNGRSQPEANRLAEELQSTLGVPAGAGSDAHTLREIGSVYLEMEAFDGAHDFVAKLRSGNVVIRRKRWRLAAQRLLFNRRP
jgi:predicted metal-dependent phosphoesterase TrpH